MLFVPAAFTMFTGKDHWHTLLKARAIENQAFVVAPGQMGSHRRTTLAAMAIALVVDPWGTVWRTRRTRGVVTADLDFGRVSSSCGATAVACEPPARCVPRARLSLAD
ncbi:MAG: nitrilase-related carbon-nitrogen hydrolase [Thermomicrobiales bacterium]